MLNSASSWQLWDASWLPPKLSIPDLGLKVGGSDPKIPSLMLGACRSFYLNIYTFFCALLWFWKKNVRLGNGLCPQKAICVCWEVNNPRTELTWFCDVGPFDSLDPHAPVLIFTPRLVESQDVLITWLSENIATDSLPWTYMYIFTLSFLSVRHELAHLVQSP